MHDFSGVYRVGGLVVDRTEAPMRGVVEIVRDLAAPVDEDSFLWPEVTQVVRTDTCRWQAWTRKDSGWTIRESFDGENTSAKPGDDTDAKSAIARRNVGLTEFLRRAMLPAEQPPTLNTLARRLASHAREQAGLMLLSPEGMVNLTQIQREWRDATGFSATTPRHAARLAAALPLLEEIRRLASDGRARDQIEVATPRLVWLHPSPGWKFTEAAFSEVWRTVHKSLGLRAKDTLDYVRLLDIWLCEFLRTVLTGMELSPGGSQGLSHEHRRTADEQVQTCWPACVATRREDSETLPVIDPNTGCGDYLLAAVSRQLLSGMTISLIGYETHPLALGIAGVRLEAALRLVWPASCQEERTPPRVVLRGRNLFRDGWPGASDDHNESGVIVGESRPHIGRGERIHFGSDVAERGWGGKIVQQDQAIESLLWATHEAFRRNAAHLACLRLPAEWADDDKRESIRMHMANSIGGLIVDSTGVKERPRDRRHSRGEIVVVMRSRLHDVPGDVPAGYTRVDPRPGNRYSWLPVAARPDYLSWPSLTDLARHAPWNGPIERRGLSLIDIDKDRLLERLQDYFGDLPDAAIAEKYPTVMRDAARFPAAQTRGRLRAVGFSPRRMTVYSFRPFDDRHIYTYNLRPLFSEPANELFALTAPDNFFLVASAGDARAAGGVSAWFGRKPCDYDFFAGHSGHFPIWIFADDSGSTRKPARVANLSDLARDYLRQLGYAENPDEDPELASLLWYHALAILYTPTYREKHRDVLRHGWPRIPLPSRTDNTPVGEARERLETSATLGRRVAEILMEEKPSRAEAVELANIAAFTVDGRVVDPKKIDPALLAVNADWGVAANDNAVRPRKGTITERDYTPSERERLRNLLPTSAKASTPDPNRVFGNCAVDAHLNDRARWAGILANAWRYTICGRRILAKWLSYREKDLLGRPLTPDEIRHFTHIARRLVRLCLLEAELKQAWTSIFVP